MNEEMTKIIIALLKENNELKKTLADYMEMSIRSNKLLANELCNLNNKMNNIESALTCIATRMR